jgi:hypothetical protein
MGVLADKVLEVVPNTWMNELIQPTELFGVIENDGGNGPLVGSAVGQND